MSSPEEVIEESNIPIVEEVASALPPPAALSLQPAASPLQPPIESENPAPEESVLPPTDPIDVFDPYQVVQLGDIILIRYTTHKEDDDYSAEKNPTHLIGTVYYSSPSEISIQPLDAQNRLYTFEIEDNDDEIIYKPYHGVTEIIILRKRRFPSFVEQQNFFNDQRIDTITESGESGPSYIITEVNKEKDFVIVQENVPKLDEEEAAPVQKKTIEFNFTGIPRNDEDITFVLMMNRIAADVKEENEESEEAPAPLSEEDIEPIGLDDIIEEDEVIEVEMPTIYREAKVFEQYIPNDLQKMDAFADFIKSVPLAKQTDPKEVRKINTLIETLFYLKESVVSFESSGAQKVLKPISAKTIADVVANSRVPLGRPVLTIDKKVYYYLKEDEKAEEPDPTEGIVFADFDQELEDMKKEFDPKKVTDPKQPPPPKVDFSRLPLFLQKYASPWKNPNEDMNDVQSSVWNAFGDTDVFRRYAPAIDDEKSIFVKKTPGITKSGRYVVDTVDIGIERALSTTYRKTMQIFKKSKKSQYSTDIMSEKEVYLPSEKGITVAYLLFPLDAASYLGNIRSNHLAIDSGLSKRPYMLMKDIIMKYGTPVQIGSSDKITLFVPDADKIGNIPVEDFIHNSNFAALRLHDTFYALVHYGLDSLELSVPLYDTLVGKIKKYQRIFISELNQLRATIKDSKTDSLTNYLIDEVSCLPLISNQPLLRDEISAYEKYNTTLSASDVGLFAYLFKKYANYVQVSIGKKSFFISSAREAIVRMQYIEQERNKQLAAENTSVRHIPNRCKHVGSLVTIRKIRDDTERFRALVAFVKHFQGPIKDNWITCKDCSKDLLCIHERKQIHGFLFPAEKTETDKQIILSYSGGQFQGRYICKHCGQMIRDYEFDNTIEYDEDGRPKSGNAVLRDEEAEIDEDFEELFATKETIDTKKIRFITDESRAYYAVIVSMITIMGIEFSIAQINQILQRTHEFMQSTIASKDAYDAADNKEPYDQYRALYVLLATAMFVLIEIQCTIPAYNRQYIINNKVYNLEGYPLNPLSSETDTLSYIAIVLLDSFTNRYPWSNIPLYKKENKTEIVDYFLIIMTEYMALIIEDNDVAECLYKRRKYNATSSKIIENIPASFLPEPIYAIRKKTIAAEGMALQTNKSHIARVQYWIKMAHDMVQTNVNKQHQMDKMIKGTVFTETTCCPTDIANPHKKMVEDESYPIGLRAIRPAQPPMLLAPFIPRTISTDLINPDAELYYRLFLTYCAKGARKGHVHELTLTYKCMWCEFTFPENPTMLEPLPEGNKQSIEKAAADKVAADKAIVFENGITATSEEFMQLLDAIHRNHNVLSYDVPSVSSLEEQLQQLSVIPPQTLTLPGWKDIIDDIIGNILPHIKEPGITNRFAGISEKSDLYKTSIHKFFQSVKDRQVYIDILGKIKDLPWSAFCDVLQAYFVIPFQRIISDFKQDTFKVPFELDRDLSDIHVGDIDKNLQTELKLHASISLSTLNGKMDIGAIKNVISTYLTNLSYIISFKNKICFREMKTDELLLMYIKEIIMYGSFMILFTMNKTVMIQNILRQIVIAQLDKFNNEKLSFDAKEIASRIEARNEKERSNIINKFDKMSDEEKKIELMKKKLGLGDWAVGGTKLIYAYDKDYYDLEREKRIEAGIVDFPGLEANQGAPSNVFDILEMGEGEEEGYDPAERNDEDE